MVASAVHATSPGARLGSLVGSPWFWVAAIGLLFGAPFLRGLLAERPPAPPPVLGTFPPFALGDDRGERLSTATLGRHAFIANLLCTGCGAEGSLAAETLRKLQHRSRNLGDALWLLSFSPDADAGALAAIRREHPSSERLFLLAGAPASVRALFPAGKGLVLVDGRLRIRGRYPGTTPTDLDDALRDAARVLAEP